MKRIQIVQSPKLCIQRSVFVKGSRCIPTPPPLTRVAAKTEVQTQQVAPQPLPYQENYAQQQQQYQQGTPQMYAAPPPLYPVPPPPHQTQGGGIAWWIWFLGGFAFATLIQKLTDMWKSGPAGFMGQNPMSQQAMMDQMMKQMMQAQQAPPSPPPTPAPFTVDTTASTVSTPPPQQPVSEQAKGDRFNELKQTEQAQQQTPQSSPQASFFSDAAVNGATPGATATQPITPEVVGADDNTGQAKAMFDMMIENKQFRDAFKQYLPKEMQDDETMLSLMKNPEIRKQMEQQIAQQIKNPEVMNQMMGGMKGMGAQNMQNAEDQLKQMGTNPQELMSKMMQDKDMQSLIMKPNVMKALFAMQQDPSKAFEYMGDPDVQKMMFKMQQMFPQQAGMMPTQPMQPQQPVPGQTPPMQGFTTPPSPPPTPPPTPETQPPPPPQVSTPQPESQEQGTKTQEQQTPPVQTTITSNQN